MPTYRNNTKLNRMYGGIDFPTNIEVKVTQFIPYELLGLEKTSDEPKAKTLILFSDEVSTDTIDLTKFHDCEVYVSAYTTSSATLYFGDDTQGVLIDTNSSAYTLSNKLSAIGKITVDGTARIVIERR